MTPTETDTKPLLLDHVDMRMVAVESDQVSTADRYSIVQARS